MMVENGGGSLLKRYQRSLSKLLAALYPDFTWDPLRFSRPPRNHWNSIENQREFLLGLAKQWGMKEGDMEAWYKVSYRSLLDNGGSGLLRRYNDSTSALISAAFPEYNWEPMKFLKSPQHYWSNKENQRIFMDDLSKKLGFKEGDREPWYKVSHKTLNENGGSGLLAQYHGSYPDVLKGVFPEFDWQPWKFARRPSLARESSQGMHHPPSSS